MSGSADSGPANNVGLVSRASLVRGVGERHEERSRWEIDLFFFYFGKKYISRGCIVARING